MRNSPLGKLTKRSEFLAAAQTELKYITPAFILQLHNRTSEGSARYGVTASRKVGGAVQRNFAKRRLRALIHQTLLGHIRPGTDYVFIARTKILTIEFARLTQELEKILKRLT